MLAKSCKQACPGRRRSFQESFVQEPQKAEDQLYEADLQAELKTVSCTGACRS